MAPGIVVNAPEALRLGTWTFYWPQASGSMPRGSVALGDEVMIGPHTIIDSAVRGKGQPDGRTAKDRRAVTIGANAWVAGNCTVSAGATIGEGTTIGAQSVVRGNIPAKVFAAGSPCRVVPKQAGVS